MEHNLPKRFWLKSEYPEGEEKPLTFNLKSTDFKKVYSKIINPFLKTQGFKCSGFKAQRETEHTLQMVSFDTYKNGEWGQISVAAHPKGLPTLDDFPVEKNLLIYEFLIIKQLKLPNGNKDFDLGKNEEAAAETCQYILEAIKSQGVAFFDQFLNFPESLLAIDVNNFDSEVEKLIEDFPFPWGSNWSIPKRALFLARIHYIYGKKENATALAKLCIALEEKHQEIEKREHPDKWTIFFAGNIINGTELHRTKQNNDDWDAWRESLREKQTE